MDSMENQDQWDRLVQQEAQVFKVVKVLKAHQGTKETREIRDYQVFPGLMVVSDFQVNLDLKGFRDCPGTVEDQ